jgi:predicted dehydrogenase
VGVLGLGFMGKTHARIYLNQPGARWTCFCDCDPRVAAGGLSSGGNLGDSGGAHFDLRTLTAHPTLEALIADPQVDLVDICLPTYLHADAAIRALRAGKHVLCEKPLTTDLREAARVEKAAAKARGFFMAAHCMRFWPEWAWLKAAVASRRYGRVHSAVFKRFAATPTWTAKNWILNPSLSGAALFDLHVHDADFVRYVFGAPYAVFAAGNGGKATRHGVDHVVATYLYRDKNLLVSAEGGWNADPSFAFTMRYTVVFEKATADFDLARTGQTLRLHLPGAKEPQIVATSPRNGWEEEIAYFLRCIETGRAPTTITPADARAAVALLRAELQSVRTRKLVRLKSG